MDKLKLENLDDGAGFLAWACNVVPYKIDTGHECKFCRKKVWIGDRCWIHRLTGRRG